MQGKHGGWNTGRTHKQLCLSAVPGVRYWGFWGSPGFMETRASWGKVVFEGRAILMRFHVYMWSRCRSRVVRERVKGECSWLVVISTFRLAPTERGASTCHLLSRKWNNRSLRNNRMQSMRKFRSNQMSMRAIIRHLSSTAPTKWSRWIRASPRKRPRTMRARLMTSAPAVGGCALTRSWVQDPNRPKRTTRPSK